MCKLTRKLELSVNLTISLLRVGFHAHALTKPQLTCQTGCGFLARVILQTYELEYDLVVDVQAHAQIRDGGHEEDSQSVVAYNCFIETSAASNSESNYVYLSLRLKTIGSYLTIKSDFGLYIEVKSPLLYHQ